MIWLLLACSNPPEVSSLSPAQAKAGDTVRVLGANFAEGAEITLGGRPMEARVLGAAAIEATVPEGLEGPQELLVRLPDGAASATLTVTVPAKADAGEPCAGPYTAYSQLALGRNLVVIDRHYSEPKGKRETLRLPVDEVERIEFGSYRMEDGALCTAIFLRMENGDVHLFDDDTEVNLLKRAQEMATGMQKPIDVVADAPAEDD